MLSTYARIGRSITLFGGRVSLLGGFVFSGSTAALSLLAWVLNGEFTWFQSTPIYAIAPVILFLAWLFKKIIGHWLFRPLPCGVLPHGTTLWVEEPLYIAVCATLPFRELGGFIREAVTCL